FRHKALNSRDAREGAPPNTTIHIRPVGVNLVRSTLDGCIVVRSMSSSIIVLGWPVRPIPASLIPAGTPVFLANCYTQNRVARRLLAVVLFGVGSNEMTKKYTARCACGAVKFEFNNDPTFIAVDT